MFDQKNKSKDKGKCINVCFVSINRAIELYR